MMGMGFGLGGLGLVLMLIFWLVVIGLAVWLLSNLFPDVTRSMKSRQRDPSDSPLEILQKRYARGEISRTEYDEMRETLQSEVR